MKKIINNKKYNTDTAREVGYIRINAGNNLYEIEETLYKKRNGEYFLHGWGGAGTKYAEQLSYNSWCSGARIMPLSYEEAKRWAEKNLSVEEYESSFGEVSEGGEDGKINATFYISQKTNAEIDRISAKKALSKSGIIERAVRLYAESN